MGFKLLELLAFRSCEVSEPCVISHEPKGNRTWAWLGLIFMLCMCMHLYTYHVMMDCRRYPCTNRERENDDGNEKEENEHFCLLSKYRGRQENAECKSWKEKAMLHTFALILIPIRFFSFLLLILTSIPCALFLQNQTKIDQTWNSNNVNITIHISTSVWKTPTNTWYSTTVPLRQRTYRAIKSVPSTVQLVGTVNALSCTLSYLSYCGGSKRLSSCLLFPELAAALSVRTRGEKWRGYNRDGGEHAR